MTTSKALDMDRGPCKLQQKKVSEQRTELKIWARYLGEALIRGQGGCELQQMMAFELWEDWEEVWGFCDCRKGWSGWRMGFV